MDFKKFATKANALKASQILADVGLSFIAPRRATSMFDIFTSGGKGDFYTNELRKVELKAEEKKREDEFKAQEQRFRHEKEMLELTLRLKQAGANAETETKEQ